MAKRPRSEEDDDDLHYADHDYEVPQQKCIKKICNRVKWTRDEDEKLKKLVEQHGTSDWTFLASHLQNRSDFQCQHRWQKVLNPELIKGPWTKEEDQRVIELVQKYGPKRWSLIAKHLKGRIGKQCRERWHNHLNPEVKKSSWTEEEDRIIYEAHKRLGNRWAEIAKLLPGRGAFQDQRQILLPRAPFWPYSPRAPSSFPQDFSMYPQQIVPHFLPNSGLQSNSPCPLYQPLLHLPYPFLVPGQPYHFPTLLLMHPVSHYEDDRVPSPPAETDNSIKNHWNSTMRRKVEQEGYLQDGIKTERPCSSKLPHRTCSSNDHLHNQNQFYIPVQGHIPGYQYMSSEGNCIDHVPTSSNFIQPFDDDPDKEKKIKELELLLMSAENEIRRKRVSSQAGNFSNWSGSFIMEDMSNTLNSLGEQANDFYTIEETHAAGTQQSSPTKYLAVEANAVLSSLQTIPEFAETLELIESDPVAWSDVTSFDLSDAATSPVNQAPVKQMQIQHNVGAMECQFNVSVVLDGKKTSDEEATVSTSPSATKFSSPPTILRKKKKPKAGQSLVSEQNDDSCSNAPNIALKQTPVKTLPFSPSQFFNTCSGNEQFNVENPAFTSTPICGQKVLITTPLHNKEATPKDQKENAGFRTPTIRRSLLGTTPRTPTPFKNALAAQEKKYGPLKIVSQPLAYLEEDIREVLKEETGTDIFFKEEEESVYKGCKQENPSAKKVRKSLVLEPWEKEELGAQLFTEDNMLDVQSENIYTTSLLMIPLLEIHDNRGNLTPEKQDSSSAKLNVAMKKKLNTCTPKNVKTEKMLQTNCEWETVVYGKTEDQLIMTEQARRYLNTYTATGSTSRALIL